MIELSDERLARRGAQGDQRAFEAIYRRYHQQLYRFCLALVGNPHDAQDALQNAMVKVLRALPGETRRIELKPWLYRIARNEAIETLRRRRDQVELEPEDAAPGAAQLAERVEDRDRLRRLFADLEELPERQRATLLMRELSGLSFEQIATALETTPATARQTLYEARLGLRQMEAGREMGCQAAMRALSEADGRSRRRRDLRAHLRACPTCRTFVEEAERRRATLAALSPLPLAVSSGVLHGVLGGKASGTLATSAIAKSAATVAVVAIAGASVAGRAGVLHLPLEADGGSRASTAPVAAPPAPVSAGARGTGRATPSLRSGTGAARRRAISAAAAAPPRQRSEIRPPETGGRESSGPARTPPPVAPASSPQPAGPSGGRHGHSGDTAASPEGLPTASAHGQQTATEHKSPQANPQPKGEPRSTEPPRNRAAPSPPAASRAPHEPPGRVTAPPGRSSAPPEAPARPAAKPAEGAGSPEQPASGGDHGPDGESHGPLQR